jgi:hypothetical protein
MKELGDSNEHKGAVSSHTLGLLAIIGGEKVRINPD